MCHFTLHQLILIFSVKYIGNVVISWCKFEFCELISIFSLIYPYSNSFNLAEKSYLFCKKILYKIDVEIISLIPYNFYKE
jgi:hypothetical protein